MSAVATGDILHYGVSLQRVILSILRMESSKLGNELPLKSREKRETGVHSARQGGSGREAPCTAARSSVSKALHNCGRWRRVFPTVYVTYSEVTSLPWTLLHLPLLIAEASSDHHWVIPVTWSTRSLACGVSHANLLCIVPFFCGYPEILRFAYFCLGNNIFFISRWWIVRSYSLVIIPVTSLLFLGLVSSRFWPCWFSNQVTFYEIL